ncbi:hypothetical protein CHUAL_003160 [Chamberlinius hualienensis]
MGVLGLSSYIKRNCASCRQPVSIEKLASDFRINNGSLTLPTVVVDARNVTELIYGKDVDSNCGGQYMEMLDGIKKFILSFKQLKIKLVFFFGGVERANSSHENQWLKKKKQEIDNINEIFRQIKKGNFDGEPKWMQKIGFFQQFAIRYLYKDDPYVEVYTTIEGDDHKVAAQYARDNKAMAILTNDTVFLVYDTVPTLGSFSLDNMKTTVMDRNVIGRELGIRPSDMPILATLVGSDLLTDHDLSVIHKNVMGKLFRQADNTKIPSILNFIGRNSIDAGRLILMVRMKINDELSRRVEASINSYNLGSGGLEYYRQRSTQPMEKYSVEFFKQQTILTNIPTLIVRVLVSGCVDRNINMTLQDQYDRYISTTCVELYRPIRKKLYGIILNSPTFNLTPIKELWVSFDKQKKEDLVSPIPVLVDGKTVNMTDLWRKPTSKDAKLYKDGVVMACFDAKSSLKTWCEIPPKFQPLCIVVYYMFKHPTINMNRWEAEAFVAQALLSNADDVAHWKNLKFTEMDSRGVHLAALFIKGISAYFDTMSVCCMEIDDAMPWKYFDGKRFQFCFQQMKKNQSIDFTRLFDIKDAQQTKRMMEFIAK